MVDVKMPRKGINSRLYRGQEYTFNTPIRGHVPAMEHASSKLLMDTYNECFLIYEKLGYVAASRPMLSVTKSTRTLGTMSYRNHEITVSEGVIGDSFTLKRTLLHEIAHYFTAGSHHNSNWYMLGWEQQRITGIQIARTTISEEYTEWRKTQSPYVVVCTGCGKEVYKATRTGVYKEPHRYSCATCGGKFKRKEDL